MDEKDLILTQQRFTWVAPQIVYTYTYQAQKVNKMKNIFQSLNQDSNKSHSWNKLLIIQVFEIRLFEHLY